MGQAFSPDIPFINHPKDAGNADKETRNLQASLILSDFLAIFGLAKFQTKPSPMSNKLRTRALSHHGHPMVFLLRI
jgi:hypothetical protein